MTQAAALQPHWNFDVARGAEVKRLRRAARKNHFLRVSVGLMVAVVAASWAFGGFDVSESLSSRRLANLSRFLGEVRPAPLRGIDSTEAGTLGWVSRLWTTRGLEATRQTLALSVAAIVLAGAGALVLSLPAARNVAAPEPFDTPGAPQRPAARFAWRALVVATRIVLTFARAVSEYFWAFLLLAVLGRGAWPAVLALALHNAGILGRLGAEVVENVEPAAPRALRALGGTRLQVAVIGVLPLVLPRLLLYFFYRWETCVREATVLGLLGFTSLGYWIADARARDRYDEMVFLIALGAGLVLLGDVASAVTRSFVRRAA